MRVDDSDTDSEEQTSPKKRQKPSSTCTRASPDTDSDQDTEADQRKSKKERARKDRAARVPNKGPESRTPYKQGNGNFNKGRTPTSPSKGEKPGNNQLAQALEQLTSSIQKIDERLSKLEETRVPAIPEQTFARSGSEPNAALTFQSRPLRCYSCGMRGHFSRDCRARSKRPASDHSLQQMAHALNELTKTRHTDATEVMTSSPAEPSTSGQRPN